MPLLLSLSLLQSSFILSRMDDTQLPRIDRNYVKPEVVYSPQEWSPIVEQEVWGKWMGSNFEREQHNIQKRKKAEGKPLSESEFAHKMCRWTANQLDPMHYQEMYTLISASPSMEYMITPYPVAKAFAEHVDANYKHVLFKTTNPNSFSMLDPMTGTGCDTWAMLKKFAGRIYVCASNFDSSSVQYQANLYKLMERKTAQLQGEEKKQEDGQNLLFEKIKELHELEKECPKDRQEDIQKLLDQINETENMIQDKRNLIHEITHEVSSLTNDVRFNGIQMDVSTIAEDLARETPRMPRYDFVYLDPPWPGTYEVNDKGDWQWSGRTRAFTEGENPKKEYWVGKTELFEFVQLLFAKDKTNLVAVKIYKEAWNHDYMLHGADNLQKKHGLVVNFTHLTAMTTIDFYPNENNRMPTGGAAVRVDLKDNLSGWKVTKNLNYENGNIAFLFIHRQAEDQKAHTNVQERRFQVQLDVSCFFH